MVANAVEKKTQIITKASIVFSNMKVIISDSVNIFNRIQQKMTDEQKQKVIILPFVGRFLVMQAI